MYQTERVDPYVLMGSWGVYHEKVCKGDDCKPGRSGCPKPGANDGCEGTTPEKTIDSVKLAISKSGNSNKHTITLSGSSASGNVSTSKEITLGSGTGTLTIKLPGGGSIKLTQLNISGNKLTINTSSKVSVTKNGKPIKLQSTATLEHVSNTLTIKKAGGRTDTAEISGDDSVALDYGGNGEITIQGSAIDDLEAKFDPDELHDKHKSKKCCIYGKQYEWKDSNPYAVWWNIFNILVPIQIALAAIFIYSLHYRDSSISRSIVNQPKISTFLSILFYMCHEILVRSKVTLSMVPVRVPLPLLDWSSFDGTTYSWRVLPVLMVSYSPVPALSSSLRLVGLPVPVSGCWAVSFSVLIVCLGLQLHYQY